MLKFSNQNFSFLSLLSKSPFFATYAPQSCQQYLAKNAGYEVQGVLYWNNTLPTITPKTDQSSGEQNKYNPEQSPS